ncbi:MAG: methyltransferase domain-containing protein [Myxococcota bacterium]
MTAEPDQVVDEGVRDGVYMGRTLAQTMSYHGAGWLTRDNRDDEENTTRMHEHLGLKPGMTACDLGAGNGYHSLQMASSVSSQGRVFASDLQPEMLELLQARAASAGIENVTTILATEVDPKFPAGTCDRILIVDVYHELSDPPAVLERLRASLSATGEIVLLEYREEDPEVPIKALHKMSKAQILAEYQANGLTLTREFDDLPWQHMMFFAPVDGAR